MTTDTITDITGTVQPRVVPAAEGRRGAEIEGLPTVRILLDASAGAGFSVAEYRVPPRFSPPPHLHRDTREGAVLVVQEGRLHYWFENADAVRAGADLPVVLGSIRARYGDEDHPSGG